VNQFTGSSLVVTTDNFNTLKITLKITVVITHTSSLYRSSIYFSYKYSALVSQSLGLVFTDYNMGTVTVSLNCTLQVLHMNEAF
jgi:hypothetical protein